MCEHPETRCECFPKDKKYVVQQHVLCIRLSFRKDFHWLISYVMFSSFPFSTEPSRRGVYAPQSLYMFPATRVGEVSTLKVNFRNNSCDTHEVSVHRKL